MNSDKKKRLIIPVATLMVAIVMMAGVGYAALTSTFVVTENSTMGGEFSVTVEGYNNEDKLFKDAKIPYVVNTTDGNKTYKVFTGTNKILVEKNVTITNNTGEDGNCNISANITNGSLNVDVKNAISFEFYNGSSIVTSPVNVTNGTPVTLTMKVVLNVTSDITITNPETELKSTDITIEIVADKA